MEYELIPFLMNHLPKHGAGEIIDKRIFLFRKELDINIDRTYAWAIHCCLHGGIIEDNFGLSGRDLDISHYFNRKN